MKLGIIRCSQGDSTRFDSPAKQPAVARGQSGVARIQQYTVSSVVQPRAVGSVQKEPGEDFRT